MRSKTPIHKALVSLLAVLDNIHKQRRDLSDLSRRDALCLAWLTRYIGAADPSLTTFLLVQPSATGPKVGVSLRQRMSCLDLLHQVEGGVEKL